MGFKKVAKKTVFSGIEPKRWIALDNLKANGLVIKKLLNALSSKKNNIETKERPNNFSDYLKQHDLTEADLQDQMRKTRLFFYGYITVAFLTFIYSVFIFHRGFYTGGFTCFMLTLIALAYSFRAHFQLTQMHRRQLTLSLSQWFSYLVKRTP